MLKLRTACQELGGLSFLSFADLATHDLKLSYPLFIVILIAFMAVMIWADRFRTHAAAQPAAGANGLCPPPIGATGSSCSPPACSVPRWATGWPRQGRASTGRR